MRTFLLALFVTLPACSSPTWTRVTIDEPDGTGLSSGAVGSMPSMVLHTSGNTQTLRIAYVDERQRGIKLATRTGSSLGWDPFSIELVRAGTATKPVVVVAPDGTPYVFHARSAVNAAPFGAVYLAQPGDENPCLFGTTNGWSCESIGRPMPVGAVSARYEPRSGAADRLHVAWEGVGDTIWHAQRGIDDEDWVIAFLGTTVDDPDGDAIEASGPILFGDVNNGGAFMLHREGQVQAADVATVRSYTSGFFGWSVNGNDKWTQGELQAAIHVERSAGLSGLDAYHYVVADCDDGSITLFSENDLNDDGNAPNPAPVVDPANFAACDPDLTMDGNGMVHVVSYRSELGGLDHYRYNAALEAWPPEYYAIIDNGAAEIGLHPEIVYAPLSNELIVAYFDKTNDRLKLATRGLN